MATSSEAAAFTDSSGALRNLERLSGRTSVDPNLGF